VNTVSDGSKRLAASATNGSSENATEGVNRGSRNRERSERFVFRWFNSLPARFAPNTIVRSNAAVEGVEAGSEANGGA